MKKIVILLLLLVSFKASFTQAPCNALFQYSVNPAANALLLTDSSFVYPGYTIISNIWTIQGGGMTYTFSDTLFVSFNYNYAGTYTICYTIYTLDRVTNDTCSSNYCNTITLANTCNLQVSSSVTNESVQGANDGAIDLTVSGGTPPLSYYWDNGARTEDINGLASGYYSVSIQSLSDSNCYASYQVWVGLDSNAFPCNMQLSGVINNVSVIGGNDGSIDLTVTGGTPPYHYYWNTGATTEDISNLSPGRYYVVVGTADSSCFGTFEAWVIEPYMDSLIVDTLSTAILDTCLGFQVDSFYIRTIIVNGNTVTAYWIFIGGGMTVELPVTYTFSNFGSQMVILSINCPFKKTLTTYTTYVNIREEMGLAENNRMNVLYPYPNPADNYLQIALPEEFTGTMTLTIYNHLGGKISMKDYFRDQKINIESLSPGLYFLNISDIQTKSRITGKFIKQ